MIIGPKQVQKYLQVRGFYDGMIDGLWGNKSKNAALAFLRNYFNVSGSSGRLTDMWDASRVFNAVVQTLFKELGFYSDTVDGLVGPNTAYAIEVWQNVMRGDPASDEEIAQQPTIWPRYENMEHFYGPVGQNIGRYTLPYPMKLAWDTDTVVKKISLHKKCAESAMEVFEEILDMFGLQSISDLRLDYFGGSLNVRKMRGGDRWSTHAWAAALDFDPERNQFRWDDSRAALADDVYNPFWEAWEKRGWVSLGRERNYDYMHVQAVRL